MHRHLGKLKIQLNEVKRQLSPFVQLGTNVWVNYILRSRHTRQYDYVHVCRRDMKWGHVARTVYVFCSPLHWLEPQL